MTSINSKICLKLSQIKREGFLTKPIQVIITKKEHVKRIIPGKSVPYKFSLKDGRSKIIALAFGDDGEDLFNKLTVNAKYKIYGRMKAKKRDSKFKHVAVESTSKYELIFHEVTFDLITPPRHNTNTDKRSSTLVNDDDIKRLQNHIEKRKHGEYAIQGGQLVGGRLHRYMGCETCTKSIPCPHKDKKFYCTTCKKKSGDKKRKVCMVVTGIKITNEAGDYVDNVVCFDSEAKLLLNRSGSDFLHDDLARDLYLNVIASKRFDFTVCVLKNGTLKVKGITESVKNSSPLTTHQTPATSNCRDDPAVNVDVSQILDCIAIKKPQGPFRTVNAPNKWTPRYKFDRRYKGYVLLINNRNFMGDESSTRAGSEIDVRNTKEFFEQIGFTIFVHIDVEEKEDLEKIIREFKERVILDKPSSIFVFVFSHGENMELELTGRRREKVNFYDSIINPFSELNFPDFKGFPKIFFDCSYKVFLPTAYIGELGRCKQVACKVVRTGANLGVQKQRLLGPHYDGNPHAKDRICWGRKSPNCVHRDLLLFGQPYRREGGVSRELGCKDYFTDMLICHSALPGKVACRNGDVGTWFIRTLIEIWMNHAYNTDLETMMKIVQRSLQNYGRTTTDYSQICISFPLEFGDFYFPI